VPTTDALLNALIAGGSRREERLLHVEHLEPRPGTTAPWPGWADTSLVSGYRALGVELPWTHQVEAADAAWSGRHTVLATSTGSGKSLAFWLPALTAVRSDIAGSVLDPGRIESARRRGSVLYLCPTKALAADQLTSLSGLLDAAQSRDVRVATCDGDTPFTERVWVQDHADVVLTNPDFLHFSLLPHHRRWARLLRSLRYVVVDECHAFRGVFGAHVAAVLRRLRRLAALYGANPVFLLASATTGDPALSAARLLGVGVEEVVAVTDDASPAGRRTFALWEPPPLPGAAWRGDSSAGEDTDDWALPVEPTTPEDVVRRSATAEVADLLTDLTVSGARTLAFARSRRSAESIASNTRRLLSEVDTSLADQVAAYRAGYLPEERRALESAIRDGRLHALATTSALELGVDISGLDAVLMAGWPGTRVSFWQQAGRAGRAGADGLVVLVARGDPLDSYLIHHPKSIFSAGIEATVFDPANPYVLAAHLCAAAAESPITAPDLELFGPGTEALLDELVRRGALRCRPSGWYWTHPESATRLTDLRGTGGRPVRIVEASTGRVLGTVDPGAADTTVHPDAIYMHQGVTFVVQSLDLDESVALAEEKIVDYGTWARWVTSVEIRETRQTRQWGPITWGFGLVNVTTQVLSFRRRRLRDSADLGGEELNLPARTLTTAAVWWTAPADVLAAAGVDPGEAPGALHAAEHASIGLLPLLATCDRWDLGGVSTALHADTECATVFEHDAFPGGAGFAERGYELGAAWLRATRDAVAECSCLTGCPSCVQSLKCGNSNNPLDKAAAVRLLDTVLSHAVG
jgi:DEAD/DEAH box helicase domain-containing protein